jgi:hypothetical protein
MRVQDFFTTLTRSAVDSLRNNRLPASLSVITLFLTAALAFTSNYDERPRFRKMALPQIDKAERQFFTIMEDASAEPDATLRLQYFLEGHRRAKAALRLIRSERPFTPAGRRAHRELVRYYEMLDEQLSIIRTEASFNDSFDYIAEWNRRNAELLPVRQRWLTWIQANP